MACADVLLKYTKPNLADMEMSMQAATGQAKESATTGMTEMNGKRKQRDEIGGVEETISSFNHGRI